MTMLDLTEEDAILLKSLLERERRTPNIEEQVILMTIEAVTDAVAPHRGPDETVHGAVRRLVAERDKMLAELDRLTKLVNEAPIVPELSGDINWPFVIRHHGRPE